MASMRGDNIVNFRGSFAATVADNRTNATIKLEIAGCFQQLLLNPPLRPRTEEIDLQRARNRSNVWFPSLIFFHSLL